MKKTLFFCFLFCGLLNPSWAIEDYYHFENASDQQRFQSLTTDLRCLVCQNQNIAESNAPLASDLRDQIYQKIQQGQSNQVILDYLVARYGNFILYKPPFNKATYGLWLGPFLALFSGLIYLIYNIQKRRE